jgi:drug/metabolite transporter (DMT)-like permease
MSWIYYSLIMYAASVFQYVLIRKVQKMGVNNKINTFMFLTPALPFLYLYARILGVDLAVSGQEILIIAVATYFFSYLGNVFSFLGIAAAPNTGYSLIIQKSYAIYTAVAAVFLFGAKLSFQAMVAIVIIVLFSGTIMLDQNKVKKVRSVNWLVNSILAFFCFGNLALFSKFMQSSGIHAVTLVFYVVLFNGLFNGIELWRSRGQVKFGLSRSTWGLLVLIGLSNGIFNLMMQLAYTSAPNIGYVNIINAASITAITVLSAYFFKDKLTTEKIIGVIGVVLGLVLLVTL